MSDSDQTGIIKSSGVGSGEANWQFHDDDQATLAGETSTQKKSSAGSVKWTASEFIAHDKSASWYLVLGAVTIVLAALLFLFTKHDRITTGMVVIMGILFGVIAAKKPRELPYEVSDKGVQIGNKLYPYSLLRSFAVVNEGGVESVWLMPLKRFMPVLSLYFDPKDKNKITKVLAEALPVENHELSGVDRLMHHIRF